MLVRRNRVRRTRTLIACSTTLLVAAAAAPAAQAATVVASPGALQSALNSARGGDTVQLRGGIYRDRVNVPVYASTVTLVAAPGARPVLSNLHLTGGRHLRLQGLDIQGLHVNNTDDLTLAGNDMTVAGVFLDFTDNLQVLENKVHDAWDGLVISDARNFTVARNDCYALPVLRRKQSGDCLQMSRVHGWSIVDNHFHDQPAKPHVDAVELSHSNSDGLIARNRFEFVRGIVLTKGHSTPNQDQLRITVVNNLFAKTRSFAFNGARMVDSRFLYNTAPDGGFVQIGGASRGNVVVGNIMRQFNVDPSRSRQFLAVEDFNIIASVRKGYRRGPNDIAGTASFVNPAARNYRLAPGSKGINAGWRTWMPVDDLTGAIRRQPDMGAYAF